MKKALLIMTVIGMGVAQPSAAAEMTFEPNDRLSQTITNISASSNYASSRNIYSTNNNAYLFSNDEISQAINDLSAHAKQKEDQLAVLTNRLAFEKQQRATKMITSNSAPAIAAARASRAALSRSSGYCARYVRKALQAAGYQFTPNASAYQYATRGTLAKAGFTKIDNNATPQIGDVVVFNRTSRRPHGHIQIFDGRNWVSDFRQKNFSPYSGTHTYTMWRDSNYVDDASNRGIYLAMADD